MEGTIGVDSIPGQGTTFWFTARCARQYVLHPTAPTLSGALQGLRVLVVDDNNTCRCILEDQLRAWGMQTQSAAHGAEALDMLRANVERGESYDLAIVDKEMPELDGIALARAIQAERTPASVRILLLTAGWQEDTQDLRRCGIAACVPKPVRQARLYNGLVSVLGSPEAPEPTRTISLPNAVEHNATFQVHILLAEDNQVNKEVATGMLESLGCTVDVVDNGLQVLEAVSSTTYDLIFMDCEMPEMDGFEAAKALRAREATTAGTPIPIIALTAHVLAQHQQACLAAGMDDFLSKPFTREQLQTTLVRWLPSWSPSPARNEVTPTAETMISESPESPIDPAALESIRAMQRPGRPDVLQRVIQSYLGHTPQLLTALREAVAHDDAAAMEHAAHSMKSSSAQMGARYLAQLCKEIEAKGHAGDTVDAADMLASIEAEFVSVQHALSEHLDAGFVSAP
jgi:CheY-like chemotaxis protein